MFNFSLGEKRTAGFPVVLLFLIIGNMFNACNNQEDRVQHKEKWEQHIVEQIEYFKNNSNSPLKKADKFTPPEYFAYDPKYRFEVRVHVMHHDSIFRMMTTQGRPRFYEKFGYVELPFADTTEQLYLLNTEPDKEDPKLLFVPFTDKTSGSSTYGGGRYLDISMSDTNQVVIDFNYAYNPYCVYNARYSCPIPPDYNHLALPIEAGEKKYLGEYVGKRK